MKTLEPRRSGVGWALLAACVWATCIAPASAQRRGSQGSQARQQEQDITLPLTRDGVSLRASYYPSTKGHEAAAVILLHDYEGSRQDVAPLAGFLNQELDVAVLAPDLRGHGESATLVLPNGQTITAEPANLRTADYAAMVQGDLEAARHFLVAENNAGRLNMDKLALVGVGMSTVVAVNWIAADWSWPPVGGVRQGQFAKAVVLISPTYAFGGLTVRDALQQASLREAVGVAIIYGEQASDARDATRMVRQFETARKPRRARRPRRRTEGEEADASETPELAGMTVLAIPNALSGTELLTDDASMRQIQPALKEFLGSTVVNFQAPWEERTSPLP